jgi:hypothetical protein
MISPTISSSYGMTGDFMSGSFINDVYYVCDEGSGTVWALNMRTNTGAWHEERLSSPTTEGPAVLYNHDDMQLYAPQAATVGSLLNYRLMPGTARGKDFDTLSESFEAWTPEIWPVGPEAAITPRYLYLKIRQRGGDAGDGGLVITPVFDGRTQTARTWTPQASAGVYREQISIGEERGVSSVQIKFTQTLASTDAAVLDIEEATLGFNVEAIRR